MIEYIIITCNNPAELVDLVNERLRNGWSLQGGICVSSASGSTESGEFVFVETWAQAMVKL